MDKNQPQNITYYSKIRDICFYVSGNEENKIESTVEVTNKEVMKGDFPMKEGVYDAHMGTTDNNWNCHTCHNRKTICPGHFGSMELNYPVKSPMFRDELLKWCKIICYYCGKLVVPLKTKARINRRLGELVKVVRTVKKCPHCKKDHMQVYKDKRKPSVFYRVIEEGKITKEKLEFYNHEIEKVMQMVDDKTVEFMGKCIECHPSKFILRVIPVPPNTIRADLRRVGGARSSNTDTTSLLKSLIEIKDPLPIDIPENISQDLKDMYSNLDMTYFAMVKGGGGGDIKVITNTNKPPVSIAEHWPKKTGRIRKNLMGKRVEYMIRSVITGDARLKINEVGVPMSHARNLEIPEVVTKENMSRLMVYFLNKNNTYPGCKRIIKKSSGGNVHLVEFLPPNYILQEGDTVLRDMITGDYLNFNRQPSLLPNSIAGMKVVVMETGDTLKLNPNACHYFNADFDGDLNNLVSVV
jgi:DNA-directed RNA polymerase beta' subunit